MKKKGLIIAVGALIIFAVASMIYAGIVLNGKEKEENKYLVELKMDQLREKIKNKESFILLISQTTCSHCAEFKPRFKKVLAENKVTAYYIEKDLLNESEENELKTIANITGTPTTIFIVDGEEANTAYRISGSGADEQKIKDRLIAMNYISE